MKIKYMGSADVRRVNRGETFGGRLADPIATRLVFDSSNGWVVDTDDVLLSEAATELLLEEGDFLDVSGLQRYPDNEHQRIFMARRGGPTAESVKAEAAAPVAEPDAEEVPDALAQDAEPVQNVTPAEPESKSKPAGSSSGSRRSGGASS